MAAITDATLEMQREQETLRRRLRSAARTDALTRLPNREAAREQLQGLLERGRGAEGGRRTLRAAVPELRPLPPDQRHPRPGAGDRLLVRSATAIRWPTACAPACRCDGRIDPAAAAPAWRRASAATNSWSAGRPAPPRRSRALALRLLDALARPHAIDGHEVACRASIGLLWGPAAGRRRRSDARRQHRDDRSQARRRRAPCVVFEPPCANAPRAAPTSKRSCAWRCSKNSCSSSTSRWSG
jgi:GGDEF domain-containing protein